MKRVMGFTLLTYVLLILVAVNCQESEEIDWDTASVKKWKIHDRDRTHCLEKEALLQASSRKIISFPSGPQRSGSL